MSTPSVLPPRTLAKLKRLPKTERMLYAQELIGSYEYRRNHLRTVAKELAEEWMMKQAAHLDKCIEELDSILSR